MTKTQSKKHFLRNNKNVATKVEIDVIVFRKILFKALLVNLTLDQDWWNFNTLKHVHMREKGSFLCIERTEYSHP